MKKLNGLDKYVIFSISVLIIFTIAEMVVSFWTGAHDTLTTAIFATFGGEILACALIKIFKLRGTDDNTLADPRIDCPDLQCGGDDMANCNGHKMGD
jgi:hypothetical protein